MIQNNIKEITIKELKTYFDNPSGYLLLLVFVGLLYFLFLKTFFIFQSVSLNNLFSWVLWLYMALISAVTMGSFAREQENQTIEYLVTKPVTRLELILGKIFGSFIFIYLGILLTTPLIYFVSRIGTLDYGETFANYLGTAILTFALCALGVGISSFFKNQIGAFLFTALIIFVLIIISTDFTAINLPVNVSNFLANFSVAEHYKSLTRGVLEIQDIVYFVLMTLIAATLAYLNLAKIQQNKFKSFYKNNLLIIMAALFIGTAIYAAAQYTSGRIDLTSTKKYTLSSTTREILKKPGTVKIQVYASPDMPTQFLSQFTDLKNTLYDYKRLGGNSINIEYLNPKDHETDLNQLGINAIEFRVYGEDQIQAQKGYFALVITNDKDKKETLPNISNSPNLEYDLSRMIYKLKNENKTQVAIASGNGERNIYDSYSALAALMDADYEVKTVFFPADNTTDKTKASQPDLSMYKLLIVANPTAHYTKESVENIKNFVNKNGNLIYLVDPIDIDSQTASANVPDDKEMRGTLVDEMGLGLKVNKDLVYDLKNHSMINVSTPQGQLPMNYPFFIFATKDSKNKLTDLPENILLGWSASLDIKDKNSWRTLYSTSDNSGKYTSGFNVQPDQNFSKDNMAAYPVAAVRNIDKTTGKILVLGTAKIFDNDFMNALPQNDYFGVSMLEKVSEGIGLSKIKARDVNQGQFFYVEKSNKLMIDYGAPAISVLVLAIIAFIRFRRKKALFHQYA